MKIVRMSPIGDKNQWHEISLDQLVEQMPALMIACKAARCLPSLPALNDLFIKGELDAGMSGGVRWEEFEIIESERAELKSILSKKYEIEFCDNEELDAINSYDSWIMKSIKYCSSRGE